MNLFALLELLSKKLGVEPTESRMWKGNYLLIETDLSESIEN